MSQKVFTDPALRKMPYLSGCTLALLPIVEIENMLRTVSGVVLIGVALTTATLPTFACSMGGCVDHGPEMKPTFQLTIRFEGKPLPGARVQLTGKAEFERFTGSDGK